MANRRRSTGALLGGLLTYGFKQATPRQRLILVVGLILVAVVILVCANFQGQTPPPGVTTGTHEIHFTTPRFPARKADYHDGIDQHLVALMDRATTTLDVAAYDFNLDTVADAMVRAKQRGVRVRMVTDSDTLAKETDEDTQAALDKLRAAEIPIVADERTALMHNKFTIVDGEWIQTGSWNYSLNGTYRNNNNMIILQSPELAENYTREFEQMFTEGVFSTKRSKGVPHPEVVVGDARVRTYFAPQDKVASHIIEAVKKAEKSIYFMAYVFTHDGIGRAVMDRARAGVEVGGVFDSTGSNTPYSEYGLMKEAGLDVYTDGNPYVMHHKVMILDDRRVILGSFNFTESADKSNDENVLIIDDPEIARVYKEEYERVLQTAKNPPR